MLLLTSYVWILLINYTLAVDTTGQQNDIMPNQALEIPNGMFCFFTMSELMFVDRMQQVASSAYRVGAARLIDLNVILSSTSSYENLWGAFYYVSRTDYSNIIQYAKTRDYTSFVSTMEIETIQNESAVCICTDVGLQPNTYLSTQYCSQCNGSGGSSNQPSMADYQQELLSLGVSPSYFQTIGNLPAMQNSTGNVPQQQQPQGTNNNTGQQPGQTQSPATRSLGASATAQTPIAGASAQGNLQPQMPTSTDNNQGQGTPYKYQLLNPYQESDKLLPQSFSFYISPPYAPFDNQFVSTSAQIQPDSSSTGSNQSPPSFGAGLSGGLYQPQTNFFGGNRGSGNSAQPSLTPGFSFASYSGQYTYLSARGGNSFVNCQS